MKKKIMIIDDNPDLIFMVKRGLGRMTDGDEVIGATNAKECFEILNHEKKPDLILLDIMMPEVDGWNLFARLKEKPELREIPIVFLTAKTDAISIGLGKRAAQDYITKPFEITELKERIDKILNR
jgi:CheY-like chemotaxis protein